jgi:hypothetical protein
MSIGTELVERARRFMGESREHVVLATKYTVKSLPPRTVLAAMCIALLAFGVILTIPAFIGVLGKHYGIPDRALGRLSGAEFLVCVAGTYLTNNRSIAELSRWVPWLCAVAGAADLMGALLVAQVPLILFHPLAAFGAGVAYGYVLKVIDASGRQQRNFGIYLALFNLTMLGEFQLIAYATEKFSTASVFFIYAAGAIGALVISSITKSTLAAAPVVGKTTLEPHAAGRRPRPVVLASIFAMMIICVAYGMIWPFAQLIGAARGFEAMSIANGLSAYAVTAIAGSLMGSALPQNVNRILVFCTSLCVLLAGIYSLYMGMSYTWFFLGCAMFGLFWPFYLTLHVGIVAKADDSGRGIVLCGIAPSIGTVVGSFLGGMLVHGDNYLIQARVAAGVCVLGMICVIATVARMVAGRRGVREPGALAPD